MNRKSLPFAVFGAVLCLSATSSVGFARDNASPDWPCVQRKVPVLTSGAAWDGPPTEDLNNWRSDNEARKLAKYLISRRIPIEDAEKAVKAYAAKQPDDKRDANLTLLFAAVLGTTNDERKVVLSGIEKFNKRQLARAAELERQSSALQHQPAEAIPPADAPGSTLVAQQRPPTPQEKYDWDVRVFQERQQNLPLACEIPVLMEQRAFEIGRLIRMEMKS